MYSHQHPYIGNAFHITTTVAPAKSIQDSSYVLTSLWFFEDEQPFARPSVQALVTPYSDLLHFECDYDNGREVIRGKGAKQMREEFYQVECDVPTWLAEDLDRDVQDERRHRALQEMTNVPVVLTAWINVDDAGPENSTLTPESRDSHDQIKLVSHRVDSWEPPELETEVAMCVSPIRFGNGHLTTVTDILEWRLFHAYQGIDRVHYYSREPAFVSWVAKANEILGLNDTCVETPNLSPSNPYYMFHADQSIWYQDCMMRYGSFDEWLVVTDVDEYLFPVDEPARNAVRDRLRTMAPDVAAVVVFQTYVGGERLTDVPQVAGFDRFPRNAFSLWEPNYLLAGARYTKTIHRASGLRSLWVHSPLVMGDGFRYSIEDAQPGATGVLNLLHSRPNMYDGVTYSEVNNVSTLGWRKQWEDLAAGMTDLEVLHYLITPQ